MCNWANGDLGNLFARVVSSRVPPQWNWGRGLRSEYHIHGPKVGPRRLIRFIAGHAVTKDEFSRQEQQEFDESGIIDVILHHFQTRFHVVGRIQGFFQLCEASKGISDLFANTGLQYMPFSGYVQPISQDILDPELNARAVCSTQAFWTNFWKNVRTVSDSGR